MDYYNSIIINGSRTAMSEKEFLEKEIATWKVSQKRQDQMNGERYHEGKHDILTRKRTVIGKDGELVEVTNLPNTKHVDNQYGSMVDKKVNYLVGKPFTVKGENEAYIKQLKKIFNRAFTSKFNLISENSLNGGVSYLYPYYSPRKNNTLCFKVFPAYEVLPFWSDREHTELENFVRLYEVEVYEGAKKTIVEKVEYYTAKGIQYYELNDNGVLVKDTDNEDTAYIQLETAKGIESFNWERIPLVAFKYGKKELPLINKVKSLQDGINIIMSNFQNNMEEDVRNTILVLVNYDGQNLGEFRQNLATYGAVKVRSDGGGKGGDVRTLQIEVNYENYEAILKILKNALVENARAFDSKDERMEGTPNQLNIRSMYGDIDLDANAMETEYQAALEQLLWFINIHLANTGIGNFEDETVEFIFNRDIPMNIGEKIDNVLKLKGTASDKTILSLLPLIEDPDAEQKQLKKEAKERMQDLYGMDEDGDDAK